MVSSDTLSREIYSNLEWSLDDEVFRRIFCGDIIWELQMDMGHFFTGMKVYKEGMKNSNWLFHFVLGVYFLFRMYISHDVFYCRKNIV